MGDVRDGVSDPAPAAESVERGAGEPSASPRVMASDGAVEEPDTSATTPLPKARGDFTLPLLLGTPTLLFPPLPAPTALGCKTLGAGLSFH